MLSALCWRKVGLRKTVYPAWMGGNLFIWPGSEKCWSEESCLSGLGQRKVGLRKVVYQALVGERLFIRPGSEKNVYLA